MAVALLGSVVNADRYSSSNYVIDGNAGNTVTGHDSSTNYRLTKTGGMAAAGTGASTSYKLAAGLVPESTSSSTLELALQPSDVIAYYPLDEPSGATAFDAMYPGYDAISSVAPDRVAGQIDGAIGAIAPSSGKHLITSEIDAFNTAGFTACGWINKTGQGANNPTLVSRANGGLTQDGMWSLGTNSSFTPRFSLQTQGVSTPLFATHTVTVGTWYQLCASYEGTTMKIYVNGTLSNSVAKAGPLVAANIPLTIGARSSGNQNTDLQQVDEVKIYNRALEDAEIAAEYQAQAAGVRSGVTLGIVGAGISKQLAMRTVVKTDASSYSMSISKDHDLTNGVEAIAPIAGSIASPVLWQEGATRGFGFTLTGTNASPIDSKWGSGTNYAGITTTPTTFYQRTGAGSSKDYVDLSFRVDPHATQAVGNYSATMTVTATTTP